MASRFPCVHEAHFSRKYRPRPKEEPIVMGATPHCPFCAVESGQRLVDQMLSRERDELRAEVKKLKASIVPTILFCPVCGEQHVDKGEWATKPHRTHLCEECGHTWRPFEASTIGAVFPYDFDKRR